MSKEIIVLDGSSPISKENPIRGMQDFYLCNGLYLLRLKKQTHQAVVERVIIKAESKDISVGKPFPDSDYLFESNNDSDQGLICIYNNEQQVYYFKNGKSIMGESLEEIIEDIDEKYNSRVQG